MWGTEERGSMSLEGGKGNVSSVAHLTLRDLVVDDGKEAGS